jgi:transposase
LTTNLLKKRARYDRSKLRYPSDLTDEEWRLIEPLISPGKPGGGKRTVIMREVVNDLMYILSTGCQWRAIPKDLPPKSSVYGYFDLWTYDGTLERIQHALYEQCREQAQIDPAPRPQPILSRGSTKPRLSLPESHPPSFVITCDSLWIGGPDFNPQISGRAGRTARARHRSKRPGRFFRNDQVV